MNTKKYFHLLTAGAGMAVLSGLPSFSKATTVVVDPTNMNGWTLNSFDGNGNIVNSGPYFGTAAMETGPATPPLGIGSAHLATPVGMGDGAAAIATEGYDGTLLSSITSLSYSTYDTTNNGQQFPYLAVSINTNDINNDVDTLFFEPPYQQPSTGNPGLPDQGPTVQNQWQTWNALVGGYWDNLGNASPGTGVEPLATFELAYPLATIANGGFPGLGGIAMQVGFGSSGETEDGNVDAFTIGVGGVDTTYDFEPTAVPEPASFSLLGIGALALLRRRRRSI
jgi:PEP-CTERM motif